MSVQSSKTFLKVFGIIDIILGALQVILGVVATAGGGLLRGGGFLPAAAPCAFSAKRNLLPDHTEIILCVLVIPVH